MRQGTECSKPSGYPGRQGSNLRENPKPHTHRPQERGPPPHRSPGRQRILLRRHRSHQPRTPRQPPTLPIRHQGMENRLQRTEPKRELQQHAQKPRRTRQTIMPPRSDSQPTPSQPPCSPWCTTSNKQAGPKPPPPELPHPAPRRPHRPTPRPQPPNWTVTRRTRHRTGHHPKQPHTPIPTDGTPPSEQPRPETSPKRAGSPTTPLTAP